VLNFQSSNLALHVNYCAYFFQVRETQLQIRHKLAEIRLTDLFPKAKNSRYLDYLGHKDSRHFGSQSQKRPWRRGSTALALHFDWSWVRVCRNLKRRNVKKWRLSFIEVLMFDQANNKMFGNNSNFFVCLHARRNLSKESFEQVMKTIKKQLCSSLWLWFSIQQQNNNQQRHYQWENTVVHSVCNIIRRVGQPTEKSCWVWLKSFPVY